jgi:hypothetical protein
LFFLPSPTCDPTTAKGLRKTLAKVSLQSSICGLSQTAKTGEKNTCAQGTSILCVILQSLACIHIPISIEKSLQIYKLKHVQAMDKML